MKISICILNFDLEDKEVKFGNTEWLLDWENSTVKVEGDEDKNRWR